MTTLAFAADTLTWKQLPPLPDVPGVAAPFAGVSGCALLVAGGVNFPGDADVDDELRHLLAVLI